MTFLEKNRLFKIYKKILKNNKDYLSNNHGIKIDWVNRLYLTYTLSEQEKENIKNYGRKMVDDIINKEIRRIDKTFLSIGLTEYIGLMEVVRLTEDQVGIAFRFKYIDTAKRAKNIATILFSIVGTIAGFFIGGIVGSILGLSFVLFLFFVARLF